MSTIGLITDSKDYPNLVLMKLSAYHKSIGDTVEFCERGIFAKHYDKVYVSKIFNLPNVVEDVDLEGIDADEIVFGGTGYCIKRENGNEIFEKQKDISLPYEIEHICPDYSLYGITDTAYGFLTRGCPNDCDFCIVSKHEGRKSVKVADLSEWWNGQKNITLYDANMLACKDRVELLNQLIESKATINYMQGLDARFVTDEISQLLNKTKIKLVHFAFDLMKNEKKIVEGLTNFARHTKINNKNKVVYILTNFNTTPEEDWYRVKKVIELGYKPDVRIYNKGSHSRWHTDLQRWSNNRMLNASCKFEDYVPRKDGKSCGELYKEILNGGI